jgi:hypothetical protein
VATDQSAAQVRDLARSSPLGPHDDERHWLGVDLFDRGSKPPRLAETGLWFRQVAQDLLAEVAKVPGEARAIAEANSATLRFAAGSGSKRARSNSTPARPYICRFSILRRFVAPRFAHRRFHCAEVLFQSHDCGVPSASRVVNRPCCWPTEPYRWLSGH